MAKARLRALILEASVQVPTMLTLQDIAELTRTSRSTIDRAVAQGTFPKPVTKFGARSPRWLTADYLSWVEDQKIKQGTEAPRVRAQRPSMFLQNRPSRFLHNVK